MRIFSTWYIPCVGLQLQAWLGTKNVGVHLNSFTQLNQPVFQNGFDSQKSQQWLHWLGKKLKS